MDKKSAATLKRLLLDIYKCEKPFELLAINRKPELEWVFILSKSRGSVCMPDGVTHVLWKRLQFMNMPIIYMKLRRKLMKTEERNEFTVLNFGEFIPPYCLSLKEKVFLLTHISLTSLTVRSPHYNNDDYEKSYAVSQNGTTIS